MNDVASPIVVTYAEFLEWRDRHRTADGARGFHRAVPSPTVPTEDPAGPLDPPRAQALSPSPEVLSNAP